MDTFTPSVGPTIESSVSFNAEILQASFGDGYEQTATAGLNSLRGVYTLAWDILSMTQRDELENFFKAHKGSIAFIFQMPGESTPRKFKCKTWTRGHTGALFTLRAEFREVFDLA